MPKYRLLTRLVWIWVAIFTCLSLASPAQAGSPRQEGVQSATVPLTSWGYSDVTLRGPFAQAEYAIGLPAHWQAQPGGSLSLKVDFISGGAAAQSSENAMSKMGNIEVKLNGVSVYQTFIQSGPQTLSAPLPDTLPPRTGEYDRLEVFLRDYGPCEDALFSSLTIHADSNLSIIYIPGPLKLELADYPAPFFQRSYLPNVVDLVLPDEPSAIELQAALSVVAGLGNVTGNRVMINVLHAGEIKPVDLQENLFVIGTPQSNSLIAQVAQASTEGVPATDGVIQLVQSPWSRGKAVLLITGATGEAVQKAALALSSRPQFLGLAGEKAVIEDVRSGAVQNAEPPLDLTFTDLGYDERVVTGIGRKDIYYNFDLPLDWNLTSDANVRLKFSHSSLLDEALSSITLFLNDTPIGTVRLDSTNAVEGELIAPLPPESSLPGLSNTLLVQIEADLPDPCILPETTTAWVKLSPNSSLNLTHSAPDKNANYTLDFWPRPFNADLALADVLISLPAQPTSAEFSDAFRVASFLGSASQGRAFQPALLLGDPGKMDLSPYHVVVIGKPTRNPLLQSLNDKLPQPFISGTDTIQQTIDNVVYKLQDGLDLGFLELIPSPWNAERVLVAVTGTSDAGLQSAADFIMNSGRIWELKGDLAMVRRDKLFVTDTRNLTSEGQAAPVATAVTEITPVTTPPAGGKPVGAVNQVMEQQSLLERFPFILPVLGIASLAIVGTILALGYWMSKRGK